MRQPKRRWSTRAMRAAIFAAVCLLVVAEWLTTSRAFILGSASRR
jgi:hypothetical protein